MLRILSRSVVKPQMLSQIRSSYAYKRNMTNRSASIDIFGSENSPKFAPMEMQKELYTPHEDTLNQDPKEIEEFLAKYQIRTSEPIKPERKFELLPVKEEIKKTLLKEYTTPTAIQQVSWPIGLAGRNIIGLAITGSGKTVGFGVPMMHHILANIENHKKLCPIALVIVPTRELAIQVHGALERLANPLGLSGTPIFGGQRINVQLQSLMRGSHFVVATPGRLIDLVSSQFLKTTSVSFVVVDEADRLMDMGFSIELDRIFKYLRPVKQVTMWSATWDKKISNIATKYISNPFMIKVGTGELSANSDIEQRVIMVNIMNKDEKLMELLKSEEFVDKKVIIFVNRIMTCKGLIENLMSIGHENAFALNGSIDQEDRIRNLSNFKRIKDSILVATDVAARGLDVKDVDLVINYDFPPEIDSYIHRIGRTARAGKKGVSVSFFSKNDIKFVPNLISIMTDSGQKIPNELYELDALSKGGSV